MSEMDETLTDEHARCQLCRKVLSWRMARWYPYCSAACQRLAREGVRP